MALNEIDDWTSEIRYGEDIENDEGLFHLSRSRARIESWRGRALFRWKEKNFRKILQIIYTRKPLQTKQ